MRDPRPMEPPPSDTRCQCRNPACDCWGDCRESAPTYGTVYYEQRRCERCDEQDNADHVAENDE